MDDRTGGTMIVRVTIAVLALVGAMIGGGSANSTGAAAGSPAARPVLTSVTALSTATAASCPTRPPVTEATPAQAVSAAAAAAAAVGVSQRISVVDRSTGKVLAGTSNANSQVASESVMKLLLASYYLVLYGGYQSAPADVLSQLSYMLRYSDDATASALFTANAIPTIAARYGLGNTTNATDRAGHWGAARITARDMTQFLFKAQHDGAVGPWLIPVMAQTAANGSDGFNQKFGLNALTGIHGSKQGWGADSYFTSQPDAIHSVGYTARYFVAVLQTGPASTYADPMRPTATTAARSIQNASAALNDGTFVRVSGHSNVYRIAGGAPVYVPSWVQFGSPQRVTTITQAQADQLNWYPVDGTYLRSAATSRVYTVAGGSALYVSSWSAVGGTHPTVTVDSRALGNAGSTSAYRHLNAMPADGTYLRGYSTGDVYRIAGGAPVWVSGWAQVGGQQCAITVDVRAMDDAGSVPWSNLRLRPRDGTFIRAYSTAQVFRVAGGGSIYVPSWSSLGIAAQPTVLLDASTIADGTDSGRLRHLLFYPYDDTYIMGSSNRVYQVVHGGAHYISSWAPYGGPKPTTMVSQVSIDRAGSAGPYLHLERT